MFWVSSFPPQGTKACLGWDRAGSPGPSGPTTTGTTAVVDLWLQLLLAALQVGRPSPLGLYICTITMILLCANMLGSGPGLVAAAAAGAAGGAVYACFTRTACSPSPACLPARLPAFARLARAR